METPSPGCTGRSGQWRWSRRSPTTGSAQLWAGSRAALAVHPDTPLPAKRASREQTGHRQLGWLSPSLHTQRCPKEIGGFGFLFFPCFCHKLWARKWPGWHHLSEPDPRWQPSPRPLQLTFRGAWTAVEVWEGSRGLGNAAPCLPAMPGKVGAAPEIQRDDGLIPLLFSFLALCSLLV